MEESFFFYVISQIIGAIVAGGLLYWNFGNINLVGATVPTFIDAKRAFGLEALFSTALILTVLNVSERGKLRGINAAIAVGAVVGCYTLLGITITGASMNPARSLGAAVYGGETVWNNFWVYTVGPLVGCIIGTTLTYICARSPKSKKNKERATGAEIVESIPSSSE